LAAGNAPADYVRQQIQIAKSLIAGQKPFGVNVMLLSPFADEVARVIAEERVPVVTTGAGNPSKYMRLWKDAGVKVIPVVPSVAMAKLVTRAGADAMIAEGGESGGHIGELTTMVLVPQICDATDLPVLAAGGIADGRGVAAAFMLGACGVQLGTRFLVASECSVHPAYKEKILKATDLATITTGKRLGHPVRSLKTPFSRNLFQAEYSGISDEELDKMGTGALQKAAIDGDTQNGCFLAGQVAALVRREQPAAEILRELCGEAEPLLKGASAWVR
jgi:enoyl-[acyl-carrier protein] reductase II